MFGDTGEFGVSLDDALDGASGQAAKITGSVDGLEIFAIIKKKWCKGIGTRVEIFANAFGGSLGDENGTVFVAFTANDKFATFEVDGTTVEFDEFGDAETTRK